MFFFATIEDVYKTLEGTDGEDFRIRINSLIGKELTYTIETWVSFFLSEIRCYIKYTFSRDRQIRSVKKMLKVI